MKKHNGDYLVSAIGITPENLKHKDIVVYNFAEESCDAIAGFYEWLCLNHPDIVKSHAESDGMIRSEACLKIANTYIDDYLVWAEEEYGETVDRIAATVIRRAKKICRELQAGL